MKKRVHVAAAVITRPDGSFLVGQRGVETFYSGYWEFPGGKVEAGETPREALIRELEEELGMDADLAWPWLTREHDYEHAQVKLHFFEVPAWRGEIRDRVHSALAWQHAEAMTVGPMLPANGPILKALRLPRVMGITQAGSVGIDIQLAALERALADGLKLVQIREPSLPAAERDAFARGVVERCNAVGALSLVNGDVELARRLGASGVHLPSRLLAELETRPDLEWVGAACHSRTDLEKVAALGLDYALLGSVQATPSHPERTPLGWTRFAELVKDLPMPVLAVGGLTGADLEQAKSAGAHGIAAIRAVWKN